MEKAVEASAKLVTALTQALEKFGSWIARVDASQNATQTALYVNFLDIYVREVQDFIKKTNLAHLKKYGTTKGKEKEEFTDAKAKEYAEKSLFMRALINGIEGVFEVKNISWTKALAAVVQLGRFLLGKKVLKFALKEIKISKDSAYRYFEFYHDQCTAGESEQTAEEAKKLKEFEALHDELDVNIPDEVVLSAEDQEFLQSM